MTLQVVYYHTEQGIKPALVKPLRSGNIRVLYMDYPMTLRTVAGTEERYMRPVKHKCRPYPLDRAVRLFKKARHMGMTKAVKGFLYDTV